jgi:hypothetical protein
MASRFALITSIVMVAAATSLSLAQTTPTSSPPTATAVPTTKILAVSRLVGSRPSQEQFAAFMEHEVRETVDAYLTGQIDQWYYQTSGKGGVVFLINATNVDGAKAILEKLPLGKAGLMEFDYIPVGPLNPLRILRNAPIPQH